MAKQSAGILLYRRSSSGCDVLIVHPGGPFWAGKDLGSWSIPKGEFESNEEPLVAAKREFAEEMGAPLPAGDYVALGEFKQPSGKIIHAYALESDFNLENFRCNMFEIEWPPKSGRMQEFPENDRAAWTPLPLAAQKVVGGQVAILQKLADKLGIDLQDAAPQTSLF